jgi:hypothetical protein
MMQDMHNLEDLGDQGKGGTNTQNSSPAKKKEAAK